MKVNICGMELELEEGIYKIGKYRLQVRLDRYSLYDENSNRIKFETSDGYSYTREYDENGNEIRYEDSDGDSWVRSYDDNGNIIKYEDSDGCSYTKEYDGNGNLIKYEDFHGTVREYNNNGNCIFSSNNGKVVLDNRVKDIIITKDEMFELLSKQLDVDVSKIKIQN